MGAHEHGHRPGDEDGLTLRHLGLRVRALVAPRRAERDLDDEHSFHLEMETGKLVAAGLSQEEARARAQGTLRLGAARGTLLMSTPAAARIGNIVDDYDPLAYAASLIVIVIVLACALAASIPALRAARIDPIATLRQE